jgi:hypothetical protein
MVAEHTPEPLPPSMLAAAHLRAPALLFRRLERADGTAAIDELVATAPLMLIASTILSLGPAERRRHWVSTSLGKLESDEVVAIAGEWWGERYGPHHDDDPALFGQGDEPISAPALPPRPLSRPA